eukprot:1356286-Pyramimonas_sp.AAC.1
MSEAVTDTTMESSSRAYVRIGENERTNVILPTLLACERHGQYDLQSWDWWAHRGIGDSVATSA